MKCVDNFSGRFLCFSVLALVSLFFLVDPGIVQGTGGKVITGLAVLFTLGALLKGWSLPAVASVFGVGAAAGYGYPLVTGMVTALV